MSKLNKARTSFVYDNSGRKVEVYSNLEVGDKLIAKRTQTSKGDFGASGMTFDYESFKKNNTYTVKQTYNWSGIRVAYVLDEDGCLDWATPDKFELDLSTQRDIKLTEIGI